MKTLTLIFFLVNYSYCQNNEIQILTNKENDDWILSLKKEDVKSNQIKNIKEKIMSDSTYLLQHKVCSQIVDRESKHFKNKKTTYYESKIGFGLKIFKKHYILNILENENTLEILKLISIENIDTIKINYRRLQTAILYGSMGRGGFILLESRNKELNKKIKKLNK